jgi:peptidoglycan/xylan/chitin deacetylase (PgdA/CDA1 family)
VSAGVLRTLKRSIRRGIARAASEAAAPGVRILMYHAVDRPDPADSMALRVTPRRFEEQMQALRDDNCRVVPLSTIFEDAGAADGEFRVAITFDDGYKSQMTAAGVLQRFGFPATFFLVPRFLDGVDRARAYWEHWEYMHWADAESLRDAGFDIGAHSKSHVDLTTCDETMARTETAGAKTALEERLTCAIDGFSYPFGRHDAPIRTAVERAGFRLACTSEYGTAQRGTSRYAVPRTEVAGSDTLQDFRWKVRGKYDWLRYRRAVTQ